MFDDALKEISARLEQMRQNGLLRAYGLIGGFACAVHGVPRSTEDIDFVLIPTTQDFKQIAGALGADFQPGGIDDPLLGVFHVSVPGRGAPVPIQLIVLPARWNEMITKGLRAFPVLGSHVPVVSWETLVLLKLYGGAPQDLVDVDAIIQVQRPSSDAWTALASSANSVGVSASLNKVRQKWHQ
ncbi:MAG: nucleotidyl transferase AbiEii/AbiGii toxin family protein [Nitrospirota bacterium]